MAKKALVKGKKKTARRAKTAVASKRSASSPRRRKQLEEKYGQAGAPWWKQHLPG